MIRGNVREIKGIKQYYLQLIHRLHDLSVSPDPLQIIKQAVFLGEYVYDHIALIHKYPCGAHASLFLMTLITSFEKLFFYIIN